MDLARRAVVVTGAVVAVLLAVVLAWRALDVLLLAFGAVILALFLRTLADWVSDYTGLGATWALVVVIIGLLALVAVGAWILAGRLTEQTQELSSRLPAALQELEDRIAAFGWGRAVLRALGRLTTPSNVERVLPVAKGALVVGGRVLADTVVAIFLGVLLAANPALYIGGLIRLFPVGTRKAATTTLARVARALRWWMLAQVTLMIVLGSTAALGLWVIGMPIPLALGALTGFLIFVPYLGALAAYAVTVVIALAIAPRLAIEATIVYAAVHVLEGYVLAPLLHWNIVLLPPALTIFTQTLLFSLLGLPGVFLATPLVASLRVLVLDVYVERLLESSHGRASARP